MFCMSIYYLKMWICHVISGFSPEMTSRFLYRRSFKKKLDLRSPRTMNEKVSWLKLHSYAHSHLVTMCADKYLVRKYVTFMGFPEILNTLYGVWDNAEQIREEELPDAFVLKCSHGCGYNLICPDKASFDLDAAKQRLSKWLRTDYWKFYAEMQYRGIIPRVICEKYMGSGELAPFDYKIYCFNGKPTYILACEERETGHPKFYFFDTEWNFCRITRDGQKAPDGFSLPRPKCLDQMLACAEKLSSPFPYVRVDLYEFDEKVVFGELTFTPSGGMDSARLPEVDLMFGDLLSLEVSDIDRGDEIYLQCREIPIQYE